jgi:hypothetical protein
MDEFDWHLHMALTESGSERAKNKEGIDNHYTRKGYHIYDQINIQQDTIPVR